MVVAEQPVQVHLFGDAQDRRRAHAMTGPEAHGHLPLPLGVVNSGDVGRLPHGSPRARLVERDRDGLAVRHLELEAEHLVHRIPHDASGDDDGGREGDRERGEEEPPRPPCDVAQHHARDGAEEHVEAVEARRAVGRGRFGAHRFGRRDGDRPSHGRERPPHAGDDRDDARHGDRPGVEPEQIAREPEVARIDDENALRPEEPEPDAEDHAERADRQRELQVVRGELARPVAERLQRGDLLALCSDDARQEDVQEKRRDAQEDDGERPSRLLELADLLVHQVSLDG